MLMVLVLGIGCSCENKTVPDETPSGLEDGSGEIVMLSSPPQRVVSLSPSATRMISELGEAERLVGVSDYCIIPSRETYPDRVGTLLTPSIEKIVSLNPELIVATIESNNQRTVDRLRELGMTVYVLGRDHTFEDICANFLALGALLDSKTKAEAAIAELNVRLGTISERIAGRPQPLVLCQVGIEPLVIVGPGSFINQAIEMAGGENIAADMGQSYPRFSKEEVIRRNPDVIMVSSMGNIAEGEISKWRQFTVISAVQRDRIHAVDADQVCIPTPEMFVKTVELFTEIFHPVTD